MPTLMTLSSKVLEDTLKTNSKMLQSTEKRRLKQVTNRMLGGKMH